MGQDTACDALEKAGFAVKTAIIMILCNTGVEEANALLANAGGRIADVVLAQENGAEKDAYVRRIHDV